MPEKPGDVLAPLQFGITPLLRMDWSWVASTNRWANPVATISLSGGSPSIPGE